MSLTPDNLLHSYVENYYREIVRQSSLNGVSFAYYKSLRGYFKHSIILTDIKQQEFGIVDYKMWDRMLTKIKSSRNPVESGGIFLKYDDFNDFCSERSYYKSRRKILSLNLIIKTPFKNYYILNPAYIIKLYNPRLHKEANKKTPDK